MSKLKEMANSMLIEDAVELFAKTNMMTMEEAKLAISKMSFGNYVKMIEASAMITPPSGQTIAPGASSNPQQKPATGPSKMKAIWPGQGSPVEMGMTVGLKGPDGLPVPGEVTQVDMGAKGVKVKNPTTGQEEWQNNDALEPYMAQQGQQQGQAIRPGTQPQQNMQTEEDQQLMRLKELAGIREDASCGASSAGAIASAPTSMGKMKRRQETDEAALKKEYTPTVAKTVIGDTKPNQASGALSANLAASGKKSAGRINNGKKR